MKIYFDESGQSGCVLQREDLLNFREQPTFAIGALVVKNEKDEKKYYKNITNLNKNLILLKRLKKLICLLKNITTN